jgi:mRNA interferase MazF
MPSTTTYEFGDVVLVPFPFTDQSTTKKRPAVVISSVAYEQQRSDTIIVAITSQTRAVSGFGEAAVTQWKAAGLLRPSAIKPIIITTVERTLILRRLGRLEQPDRATLQQVLQSILGR